MVTASSHRERAAGHAENGWLSTGHTDTGRWFSSLLGSMVIRCVYEPFALLFPVTFTPIISLSLCLSLALSLYLSLSLFPARYLHTRNLLLEMPLTFTTRDLLALLQIPLTFTTPDLTTTTSPLLRRSMWTRQAANPKALDAGFLVVI